MQPENKKKRKGGEEEEEGSAPSLEPTNPSKQLQEQAQETHNKTTCNLLFELLHFLFNLGKFLLALSLASPRLSAI